MYTHTHTHTHTHTQLSLSHNQLQELHLRFLCLPSLEKLSVAHNSISTIHTDKKVLERITFLNLSHNRLQTLGWVNAFVGVGVLNMSYNLVSQRMDLDKLTQLRMLNTLTLTGVLIRVAVLFQFLCVVEYLALYAILVGSELCLCSVDITAACLCMFSR